MCNQFTFHHQFRIDTGRQNLSKRQTVFFTSVDPMNKEHRDPNKIDLEARVLHAACIKHGRNIKTRCIGSISNFLKKKGLKFDQTGSNVIILDNTLPACCIPKAIKMETGDGVAEGVYTSSCVLVMFSVFLDMCTCNRT